MAALQALVEYSHRARLRDVTDMRVVIEHSANPNFSVEIKLGQTQDLAALKAFDVSNYFYLPRGSQSVFFIFKKQLNMSNSLKDLYF